MASIAGELVINRPVDEVFHFVADEQNEPRYNPRIRRAEKLSPGPIGRGTRFRFEAVTLGSDRWNDDPVHDLRAAQAAGVVHPHGRRRHPRKRRVSTRSPDGTRMSWSWEMRLRGLYRLLTPIVVSAGRRQEQATWAGLKRFLERQDTLVGNPETERDLRACSGDQVGLEGDADAFLAGVEQAEGVLEPAALQRAEVGQRTRSSGAAAACSWPAWWRRRTCWRYSNAAARSAAVRPTVPRSVAARRRARWPSPRWRPPGRAAGPGRRSGRSRAPSGRSCPGGHRAAGAGSQAVAGAAAPPGPGGRGTAGCRPPRRITGRSAASASRSPWSWRKSKKIAASSSASSSGSWIQLANWSCQARQRDAPGRVGGHHVARAAGQAAALQRRRQVLGQGREPLAGAGGRVIGQHQRVVLVAAQGGLPRGRRCPGPAARTGTGAGRGPPRRRGRP